MQKRLTEDSRKYLVRQRVKGTGPAQIGRDLGISARHVRRLWARFQKTGTTRAKMGRPRLYSTAAQMRLVMESYKECPSRALRIARDLRKSHDISYHVTY